MIPHLNVLTFSPLTGGCSGLDAFRFFFKTMLGYCLCSIVRYINRLVYNEGKRHFISDITENNGDDSASCPSCLYIFNRENETNRTWSERVIVEASSKESSKKVNQEEGRQREPVPPTILL